MKRFETLSRLKPAFLLAAMSGLLTGAAHAERILYESFENADSNNDPIGWQAVGHPSYLNVATENNAWSTPYGERGMSTYSTGVGTKVADFLPTEAGDYILKFNLTSNASKGEYRAELWAVHPFFGRSLLAFVAGDTDGSKDMSFSDQIAWRYEFDQEDDFNLSGAQLEIKLMQDPVRSDWRNTPIWDNVSLDFVPDIDSSPPTVVDIVDDRDGGTVAPDSTVTYTVTFSEAMDASTVDPSDFGNASSSSVVIESVTPTSDETVFLVAVRPTDAGLLRLRINQSAVMRDAVGNAMNTSSAFQDNVTITVDGINPILLPVDMVDDKEGGTVIPGTPVSYTLTFSKDMNTQSVTAADFGNAGTAPFTISSISETTPTSGIFTVVVVPSGSGTLRLKINAGALLLDADGGSLDTSEPIEDDTEITVDGTPPTLVPADITDDQEGEPVVVNTLVTYTLIFSEAMDAASVDTTDFGNAGNAPFTISSVGEASPGVFRVELTPTGGGTLRLRVNAGAVITDAAGNPLNTTAAILDDTTLTVEGPPSLAPSDIVDDRSGAPVAANVPVIYTVSFSKDMDAATVTSADFGNAGTAPVVIGSVTETSPGVFTVEVTATASGTLRLQVIAGAILKDVSGTDLDTASAILDDTTIDIDTTPPTLAGTLIVDDRGGNAIGVGVSVVYTVTFSEDMDESTVAAADFGNAGTAPATIGAVMEISPGVFTVIATPTGSGTLILRVNAGAVLSDTAGNNLDTNSAIADDTTITVDGGAPTLAASAIVDDRGGAPVPTETPVTYTVTFSKDMDAATVTSADFGNAGTAPATIGAVTEISPGVFTVFATPTGSGTLILRVNAGAVLSDTVGNNLGTTSPILDDTTITVQAAVTDPFAAWAGEAAFNDDENGDGVANALAWALGAADPDAAANGLLPTLDAKSDPDFVVFTFRRKDDANDDPNTVIHVEFGTSLTTDNWATAIQDGTDVIITETDDFHSTDPGIDRVQVRLRKSILAPGGRLFVRLVVSPAS